VFIRLGRFCINWLVKHWVFESCLLAVTGTCLHILTSQTGVILMWVLLHRHRKLLSSLQTLAHEPVTTAAQGRTKSHPPTPTRDCGSHRLLISTATHPNCTAFQAIIRIMLQRFLSLCYEQFSLKPWLQVDIPLGMLWVGKNAGCLHHTTRYAQPTLVYGGSCVPKTGSSWMQPAADSTMPALGGPLAVAWRLRSGQGVSAALRSSAAGHKQYTTHARSCAMHCSQNNVDYLANAAVCTWPE